MPKRQSLPRRLLAANDLLADLDDEYADARSLIDPLSTDAPEWDRPTLMRAYSLFLLGPRFTHDHPDRVGQWIERAASSPSGPADREIELKRIDMIAAHDAYARLSEIRTPTLVTCGTHNFCTTLALSEEIAARIPGAELVTFDEAGELIEFEQPEKFFQTVSRFIDSHS